MKIGVNNINFTNTSGVTHTIDRTILESLYTSYSLWKTSFPVVDLSPYVTTTELAKYYFGYLFKDH